MKRSILFSMCLPPRTDNFVLPLKGDGSGDKKSAR
jgi:hypothetical protein